MSMDLFVLHSSSCWCLNPFDFSISSSCRSICPHLTIADDIAERFINSIGGSIRAFLWSIHRTCRHQKFKQFYLFFFGSLVFLKMLIRRHAIKRCHDDIYLLTSKQRTSFFLYNFLWQILSSGTYTYLSLRNQWSGCRPADSVFKCIFGTLNLNPHFGFERTRHRHPMLCAQNCN